MPHDRCSSDRQAFALFISGYDCPLGCLHGRPFYGRIVGTADNPPEAIQVREELVREIAEQGLKRPTDALLDQLVEKLVATTQRGNSRQALLLKELAEGGLRSTSQAPSLIQRAPALLPRGRRTP